MFKLVVFWSEFPREVDWQKVNLLLEKSGLDIGVYIASKSKKEFRFYEKILRGAGHIIELGAWPVIPKEEGYWFSGFSSKRSIGRLREFEGLNIKLDLEPPIPPWTYSNVKLIAYGLKLLLKRPKNTEYLLNEIKRLSSKSKIVINEFPFPEGFLRRKGLYFDIEETDRNITKNVMMYTTYAGEFLRPFIKLMNRFFLNRILSKKKNVACSVGLIGPGIFENEGVYKNVSQFKEDLEFISSMGIQKVFIYSIESLMKRKEPEKWVRAIKPFVSK